MDIKTVFDFNKALSEGKWAWPGSYERCFLCDDGEYLSFEAAQENAGQIRDAVIAANGLGGADRSDWRVIWFGILETDEHQNCAHTGKHIVSAGCSQ